MSKVKITETILRDAQQSLIATRMTIDEMLPILNDLDRIGFYSLEVWGGATFDVCLRYLDEDPWERLRTFKKYMPNTKLQMLLRGQNAVGYRHYGDDTLDYFIKKSVENGIDIIRIFDALNDIRNVEQAIKSGKKYNAHVQGALSYTISDVHTVEYFVDYAKKLENLGVDSICIKDMAALLEPFVAEKLVKELRKVINVPIQVHSHTTSGLAPMALLKAIESGAEMIDTAMSPLGMGTSHMATESMIAALKMTKYDTRLDLDKLNVAREKFVVLRDKYLNNGLLDPKMMFVDANILQYQVPGGMLSNLLSQLKSLGEEDKFDDVLKEVPRVRKDVGYVPLVTPTSQIVGTQAVSNVVAGERYKVVSNEFKDLVEGKYGKTPVAIEKDFVKKIIGDKKVMTKRPADFIKNELETLRAEIPVELIEQEEDILSYIMFPGIAKEFFERRRDRKYKIDPVLSDRETLVHPI